MIVNKFDLQLLQNYRRDQISHHFSRIIQAKIKKPV